MEKTYRTETYRDDEGIPVTKLISIEDNGIETVEWEKRLGPSKEPFTRQIFHKTKAEAEREWQYIIDGYREEGII